MNETDATEPGEAKAETDLQTETPAEGEAWHGNEPPVDDFDDPAAGEAAAVSEKFPPKGKAKPPLPKATWKARPKPKGMSKRLRAAASAISSGSPRSSAGFCFSVSCFICSSAAPCRAAADPHPP